MAATLKGRVTRAVTSVKKLLTDLDGKEDTISQRARDKDPTLLTEVAGTSLQLESAIKTCEDTLQSLIRYVSEILEDERRDAEDRKVEEFVNQEDGLEDTLDKARESLNTLKLLSSKLEKAVQPPTRTNDRPRTTGTDDVQNNGDHTGGPPQQAATDGQNAGEQAAPLQAPDVTGDATRRGLNAVDGQAETAPTVGNADTATDATQRGPNAVADVAPAQRGPNAAVAADTVVAADATTVRTTHLQEADNVSRDLQQFLRTDNTKLQLPKFDGAKGDFLRFWSLFEATVDRSTFIDTVKLHILLSHLTGDAARLVSGFAFDPRNYNMVKQTLKERYASKGSLERKLYEDLFNMRCNSRAEFPAFVDKMESVLNQMTSFSIDVEAESIRMAVESALPSWVRTHLFQAQLLSDEWNTGTLRKTLKKVARLSDQQPNSHSDEPITAVPVHQKKWNGNKFKKNSNDNSSSPRTSNQSVATSRPQAKTPTPSQATNGANRPFQQRTSRSNDFNQNRFSSNSPIQCSYCKFNGHLEKECRRKQREQQQRQVAATVAEELRELSTVQMATSFVESKEVPLMLVQAPIVNLENGRRIEALVFLDSGAQTNFASQKLAEALGLQLQSQTSLTVNCFGGAVKKMPCAETRLGVQQRNGQIVPISAKCVETVVDRLPVVRVTTDKSLLRECRVPSLLVGNKDFWKFVIGPSKETIEGFRCVDSTLGTLLGGKCDPEEASPPETPVLTAAVGIDAKSLDRHIEEWNSLEKIGIHEPIEQDEDEQAWNLLKERITFEDGRYQVPLPFKDDVPRMPDNFGLCVKQMVATRNRMLKNEKMCQSADNIVKEWMENGVIEKVPMDEISHPEGTVTVYSPFHLVEKPSSKSTPYRLVHNGSAALKGAPSLNKLLCRGPVLLPSLIGVMLRFREDPVIATADVTKAFLQLGLQKPYRDALRFIYPKDWSREISANNLEHYRFCRVNFGLICSPFLLAGTFKIHFEKNLPYGPEILRDSYVDNLLFRGETQEEVQKKMEFAIKELKTVGMELSQFCSSDKSLQKEWNQETPDCSFLGVKWNTEDDSIFFDFDDMELSSLTKRKLLSQLCSRFDPLGLTFPAILKWKLAVQQLWKGKKEWDQLLDDAEISMINRMDINCPKVSLPRMVCSAKEVDLVIFVDASKDAFAAVAYFVAPDELPQLIMCRARLAPIHGATIPQLELLAALLGVRLVQLVKKETSKTIRNIIQYGDSMVVLHWILNREANVPRFNQKRLDEIRALEDCEFRYVNTKENPADLATRGCSGLELVNNAQWWHGPAFLRMPREQWPNKEIRVEMDQQQTDIVLPAVVAQPVSTVEVTRFSSYSTLLSTMMTVLIFLKKLIPRKLVQWDPVHLSRIQLLKEAQAREPPTMDQMKNLRLFKDGDNLWRSRGRIQNSELSDDAKSPIFLPRNDHLTKLIIQRVHTACSHGSVSATLAQLRLHYWITAGRATVKKIISGCTHCKRRHPAPFALPLPPQLLATRVRESTVFAHCGADLCGPFQVKLDCGDITKVWIVLLTCLSSRAIHTEIAHGLSSKQLLSCLRRFVARRGRPLTLWSDNGTNFRGAVDTVKTWKGEEGEVAYCEPLDLTWYFIPSLSPWNGGVYERAIGLLKQTLRRTIPRKLLSLDEMSTFVTEAEAVVNCRPLTYIAEDSIILRPADLICPRMKPGIPLTADTEDQPDFGFNESSIANMWSDAKQRVSKFWDVWTTDYLTVLRERTKVGLKQPRSVVQREPKIGDIVLLDEPNVSPAQWRLARITFLHPGKDGMIRSVEVKTSNGRVSRRSIATVHPLELQSDDEPEKDIPAEAPTPPKIVSDSYNLRPRKPISYAFYALCLSMLFCTATADCPPDAKVVHRQRCDSSGFVVGIKDNHFCWSRVNCPTGAFRAVNGLETFDSNHCGKPCTCPRWTTGCVFSEPPNMEHNKVYELLELVRPEVRTNRLSETDISSTVIVPVVMLSDKSVHYVNLLDVTLLQTVDPPFVCFGTGEVTGDDDYCSSHPCTNGTRFCATNKLESAVLNTLSGTVPIVAWGTKRVTVYEPSTMDNSTCDFVVKCHSDGGVAVAEFRECSPQFMEVCVRENCRRYDNLQLNHVRPPRNMLLTDQLYNVKLWRHGKKIAEKEVQCVAFEVCDLIRCTYCMEALRHFRCFVNNFSVGLLSVTVLLVILWILRRYCRTVRKNVVPRRRRHAQLLEVIPLLLFAIAGTSACGTAAIFQATSHNCELSRTGAVSCNFRDVSVVTMKNNVETCIVFKDAKRRTMSRIRLETELLHRCQPRTMFVTRRMKMSTITVRRCPGLGSCSGEHCLQTTANTTIEEFAKLNNLLGVSRCEQSCSGPSCGCGTFGSGCRYSRTIADIDNSSSMLTIIECNWEKVILATITEETSSSSRQRQLTLLPGETSRSEETFNITVSAHQATFVNEDPLERHFSRKVDSSDVALLSDLQLQSAKLLKCNLINGTLQGCHLDTSQLSCRTADGLVTCLPSDNSRLIDALDSKRIPLHFDGKHYLWLNNSIYAEDRGSVTLQVDTDGYEATLETEMSTCNMRTMDARGCFGCHEGAQLEYQCDTNFGRHLAEVRCPSTSFTVICGPGKPRTTFVNFDASTVNELCELRCPGSTTSFQLLANLAFISDDDSDWTTDHKDVYISTNVFEELYDTARRSVSDYMQKTLTTIIILFVLYVIVKIILKCL